MQNFYRVCLFLATFDVIPQGKPEQRFCDQGMLTAEMLEMWLSENSTFSLLTIIVAPSWGNVIALVNGIL